MSFFKALYSIETLFDRHYMLNTKQTKIDYFKP